MVILTIYLKSQKIKFTSCTCTMYILHCIYVVQDALHMSVFQVPVYMIRVHKTCCSLLVYVYNRESLGCHISYKSTLKRKVPSIGQCLISGSVGSDTIHFGFLDPYSRYWIQRSKYQQNYKKFPFTAQILTV